MDFILIKDIDGSQVTETYIYDFNLLTMDRIFAAEQLFIINSEFYQKQNVPGNTEQLNKEMERKTLERAYQALLMKKTANGFEKYDGTKEPDLFQYIKGADYERLLEVKNDFFQKSKTLSQPSIQQSLGLIEQLKTVIPESMWQELIGGVLNGSINTKNPAGKSLESIITQKNTLSKK